MERVKTRTAEMWKDASGIFWVRILPVVEIDEEDIVDNLLVMRNITGGTPHLKIVDARTKWKMTPSAESIFRQADTPEKTIARAVLTSSVADKLIQTVLAKLFKHGVPLRFFTNEADAVRWLLSFSKTNQHAGAFCQSK